MASYKGTKAFSRVCSPKLKNLIVANTDISNKNVNRVRDKKQRQKDCVGQSTSNAVKHNEGVKVKVAPRVNVIVNEIHAQARSEGKCHTSHCIGRWSVTV